ncbi:MAG TPA: aminotransferase class IV [Chiayiivirga sp.]|nr:aminotransferase class IV [Xanthomonadaceae bacterium]HMN33794.1 aminotransferase class IV [Chiayiivirga sp.]HRN60813.1 aminotransferase class IV [Chiayiivirga sp.]HRO88229.1 aminotransferase class IV [Chiayiivirga sp.]
MSTTRVFIDGAPAEVEALAGFTRAGYGHFTTMQVRQGAVRGLDLHLIRLQRATRALFDGRLDIEALRGDLRAALAATPDASARISVVAGNWNARGMSGPARIRTLILVDPPAPEPEKAVRLRSFVHERYLPRFKHLGGFELFHLRRQARMQGFDDAVLRTRAGFLSEGATCSLGFFSGETLVWTQAPQLDGITRHLLMQSDPRAQVREISPEDARGFDGAFCCHSGGIWPVSRIDEVSIPVDAARIAALRARLAEIPMQPI